MISLDIHKILQQPNTEKMGEAINDNLAELLGQYSENEVYCGVIGSLFMQLIKLGQFIQYQSEFLQGFALAAEVPVVPHTFEVWEQLQDAKTPEEKKEIIDGYWASQRAKAAQVKQHIIKPTSDVSSMFTK